MLLNLQLEHLIRKKIQKWFSTKKIKSIWSTISRRIKSNRTRRETLMILKLHRHLNKELIHLLRAIMLNRLQNLKLSKLIQVIFKIMSLQLHKLNKMTKLITWIKNLQRRVHLNLNGSKLNNKAKLRSKCLWDKAKTCHFKHLITHLNQMMMELCLSTGLMLTKKTTEQTFSCSVKFGNQKPNLTFHALSRLKVWREHYLLYQRWKPIKLEVLLVKKRKLLFSKVWLLSSIT